MSLNDLHPYFRPWAQHLYNELVRVGARPRITSTLRDPRQQQILYDRRQRTLAGTLRPGEAPQNYPVARPGTSRHEHGAAFDMVMNPGWAPIAGHAWQSWGGFYTPSDNVHFGDIG